MTILTPTNPTAVRNLPAEQQEQALEFQLDRARTALALALEASDVHMVAQIKGSTAVMEKLSKELRLSKECQLDAAEMVRRSEYALGKAIRQGQESGAIETPYEAACRAVEIREVRAGRKDLSSIKGKVKPSPRDFAPEHELRGNNAGIMHLADSDEREFEDALASARSEENLSRANLVRKVREDSPSETRADRADKIEPLARLGLTSEQIAKRLDLHRDSVKRIARDHGIDIQADRVTAHRPKVDSAKILESTAAALEGAVYSIRLVQPEDIGQEEALEWVDSLTESIKALSKAVKTIKEYHS